MLLGDRAKYVMLVGGLTFATMLMTQQSAVFCGLLTWTTSHMRNMRAKLWVVDRKVEQANELKALRDTDVNRVRSAPGVAWAVPVYMTIQSAKLADGNFKPVQLVGLDNTTLVGRPPFLGSSPVETIMQVINEEPVPPSQLIPKLPTDIETICLKCLQKEPEKRYISAEELAEDCRRFLAGEPILSRPISAPERVWRWCRRNPRTAGLIATVWGDGPADGLGAMAAAYEAERRAAMENKRLADYDFIRAGAEYNEVDCRAMAEIVAWLRANR